MKIKIESEFRSIPRLHFNNLERKQNRIIHKNLWIKTCLIIFSYLMSE